MSSHQSTQSHKSSSTRFLPPLSPLTYYRRNLARTLPVGGAIAISVFLVASIVTLLNSVDESILTHYGFFRSFTVLTGQFDQDIPQNLRHKVLATPHVSHSIDTIPYFIVLSTVFGEMPVPVYGVEPGKMEEIARLCGNHLAEGKWPQVNEPEVVMSRTWAANKGAKLGDMIEMKHDRLPTVAAKQKLVGILDGGENLALTDRSYVVLELSQVSQLAVRTSYLYIPKDPSQRVAMSNDMDQLLKQPEKHGLRKQEVEAVQLFSFEKLVAELRKSLGFLYTFLAVADGLVIGAVALLSGFLANIYFEQRLAEFGLLSALGFRRERLAKRLVIESGSLVIAGWLGGLLLTWCVFRGLDAWYMTPHGLILSHLNQSALLYTLPAPVIVGIASLGTVLLRLYRLDPIEIMERR